MTPVTPVSYTFDVFISYARVDRDVVEPLVTRLKKDGFTVWWDIEQMAGGSIVLGQLADGILHSAHMIACLSDAYFDRDFTDFELQTNQSLDAANRQNRTIPVRVRSLTREIPAQIRAFNSCDLTDPGNSEREYKAVIAMIHRLGKDATPAETEEILRAKYDGALNAMGDPNLALFRARIAAEAFARFLYRKQIGPPPASTLDSLVETLLAAHKLPAHIGLSLGTVQTYGNLAIQEGVDVTAVTQASIQPGIAALKVLAEWTFATYMERPGSKDPWDILWDHLPAGSSPAERSIPGSRFDLRQPRLSWTATEAVYAGVHTVSRQKVDIRLSLVAAEEEDSFFEGISQYARLGSSAILRPLDAGRVVVDGKRLCVYAAVEQVDGPTAEELHRRFGPLPEAAVCSIGAGIARALEALEGAEPPITHGGVTASNIVVDRYGNVRLLCVGSQKAAADGIGSATDLEQLWSTLRFLRAAGAADEAAEPEITATLSKYDTVERARTFLESASVKPANSLDLRTVITRFLEKRPLPEPAPEKIAAPKPASRPNTASEFVKIADTTVDATEAWPLGEGALLVVERDRGTLAIFEGDELKWRDAEPIQYRLAAVGAGNRVAVGGWDGRLRCFGEGVRFATALRGTVGAIARSGGEWLAGTWRNSLIRIADGAKEEPVPPTVDNGVMRIAVSQEGTRFAVADLRGVIAVYSQGRRVGTTAPLPGLRAIAFCGRRVIALAADTLTSIDLEGRIAGSDQLPGGPSAALLAGAAGQACLVIAEDGQAWAIEENGAHLPFARFMPRRLLLGLASTHPRYVAMQPQGCAYYRQTMAPVMSWPDANSASVSHDGRWIAVRSPGKVSLYLDP